VPWAMVFCNPRLAAPSGACPAGLEPRHPSQLYEAALEGLVLGIVLWLFMRAGAGIPTQPVIQHTGEMKNAPLTIAVAVGAAGASEIYEDAGDGYAYRKGASRTIKITTSADKVRLEIPKSAAYQRVAAVELFGLDAAPAKVAIDGKAVRDAVFDATTKRLRIELPSENVKEISFERRVQ